MLTTTPNLCSGFKPCKRFLNPNNRIKKDNLSISKLCFRQYWTLQEDKECEKMQVLTPAEFVFVGFKLKED
jgi:CRISPR type III-associated protein (TIGR04423 family)